jgi:hypothetical protein
MVEEPLDSSCRLQGDLKQHRRERAPAVRGVDYFAPSLRDQTRRGRVTPRAFAVVSLPVGKTPH